MIKSKQDFIYKIPLIISVVIVAPVALTYGFYPDAQFELFPKTIDEHNFFKAIMGLYLGFSVIWVLGIIKTSFFKVAIFSNVVFMLGLASGRMLSIFLDGIPTFGYLFGAFAELFLGCYGLWVVRKITNSSLKPHKFRS